MSHDPRYANSINYAKSMGATDHQLTQGHKLRAELDRRGHYDAEVYDWHVSKLQGEKVKSMDNVERVVLQLYAGSATALQKV